MTVAKPRNGNHGDEAQRGKTKLFGPPGQYGCRMTRVNCLGLGSCPDCRLDVICLHSLKFNSTMPVGFVNHVFPTRCFKNAFEYNQKDLNALNNYRRKRGRKPG